MIEAKDIPDEAWQAVGFPEDISRQIVADVLNAWPGQQEHEQKFMQFARGFGPGDLYQKAEPIFFSVPTLILPLKDNTNGDT